MDFIELTECVFGKKVKKKFPLMQLGDVKTNYPDINSLVEDFGYKPNKSLKEGISESVKLYIQFYHHTKKSL